MKSALVIRHVPYEDLAAFRAPISQAGYAIGYADVGDAAFDGIDFLAPDLLILMGGPMGVYETDRHPWIPHELERSEEHTSELQSLMRISYAVFCLKKKKQ